MDETAQERRDSAKRSQLRLLRKCQKKCRPLSDLAFAPNCPAKPMFDKITNDIQSQSASALVAFRCKKRVENFA